jgi:hypothetical protein
MEKNLYLANTTREHISYAGKGLPTTNLKPESSYLCLAAADATMCSSVQKKCKY